MYIKIKVPAKSIADTFLGDRLAASKPAEPAKTISTCSSAMSGWSRMSR